MSPWAEIGRDLLPWGLAAGAVAALDRLRAYQPRPRALADHLAWATVPAPGVVQARDGALSRTWRYRGVDTRVAAPEELNALSRSVSRALARLGPGVMLHADAVRRPALPDPPGPHFPHPVPYLFDRERYQRYRRDPLYETAFYLTLTYRPPDRSTRILQRLFLAHLEEALPGAGAALGRFDDLSAVLESHLGTVLALERLPTAEQLAYLHLCLTGDDRPVAAPAPGQLLAPVLCDQEFHGGWRPRIGRRHLWVVRLQAYPTAETRPALLDPLTDLACSYRWSTRVLVVSPEEADAHVKRRQWLWYTRRQDARTRLRRALTRSGEAAPDRDEEEIFHDRSARALAADAGDLLARLHGGEEVLCAYTTKVVVMDEDPARAEAAAAEAVKALARRGFGAAVEAANTIDAWMGSLPGHGSPDLRRDAVPSLNVADLLPLTGSWPGLATIPSPYFPPESPPLMWTSAEGATPFRFNLHAGDVFHGLVLGPTGAGKSYLTAHLALQFLRYPQAQVFVFDKGYSHYLPCVAAGGIHYDIASPRGASRPFQPLREIDGEGERAWAASWLETVLRLQGLTASTGQRNALARALELLAQEPPAHRTLDMLSLQLPDPEIQAALKPYLEGGPLASLLNGSGDPLESHHYLCFELGHVLEADPRALVPVQLYLAHALARRRTASRPTLLIWDEAWRALADPACRAWITNDLATARKQNCGVVLITQSLAQVAEPGLRTLIDEAAQSKILLPNPGAVKPETRKLYEALGIPARLCERIAALTPKRDYLYASRQGCRVFQLGSTDLARALLSPPLHTTEEALVEQIRRLQAEEEEGWIAAYLRRRGLEDRAAELEALAARWPAAQPPAQPSAPVSHPSPTPEEVR